MTKDPPSASGVAAAHWEQVIEDLREQAAVSLDEVADGQEALSQALGIAPFSLDDTVEMDAVRTIRHFAEALTTIAEGGSEAAPIARAALDAGR